MVTCNGYRHPALLTKMASTVDALSHGRLNVGIGAGGVEQEYRAYGYDYHETPERLRQLREAVQVILALWTQEKAAFEGNYYQVRGAINQPKGVQQPHIPLLIGGGSEQVTLKLVAQYGDACHVSGSLETIQHKFALLKQHCEAVRREYEQIRRTVTLSCMLGETDEQAEAKVPSVLPGSAVMANILVGGPATLRKRLSTLEEIGEGHLWRRALQSRSVSAMLGIPTIVSYVWILPGFHAEGLLDASPLSFPILCSLRGHPESREYALPDVRWSGQRDSHRLARHEPFAQATVSRPATSRTRGIWRGLSGPGYLLQRRIPGDQGDESARVESAGPARGYRCF
jgi:hypothetical protein